jgi:hypothetical protein
MNICNACLIALLAVPADPRDAPLPLPPLSFESRASPQQKAEGAKLVPPGAIAFDDRYRVPNSQAPDADFSYEQAAIRSVVQNMHLKWTLSRGVYGIPASSDPISTPPQLVGMESVPITVLPDPLNVVAALAGVKPSPSEGVFLEPTSVRPDVRGGKGAVTVFFPRVAGGWISDSETPRMQGVSKAVLPNSPAKTDRYKTLGRIVSRYGVMAADHLGLYDNIIGSAGTVMITKSIWYYQVEVANPHKGKRRGSRMGVLDDATHLEDWCFPILDANGQARPSDDARRTERSSPYENLVTTALVDSPLKGQQVPVVLPTVYYAGSDPMGKESVAAQTAYEGTETVVLPQRLIDAAGGVVIVRKATSWRPLAQDVIIDGNTRNTADVLGVYVSQVVTDERLVDALCELCGEQKPTGQRRVEIIESVSKARQRP